MTFDRLTPGQLWRIALRVLLSFALLAPLANVQAQSGRHKETPSATNPSTATRPKRVTQSPIASPPPSSPTPTPAQSVPTAKPSASPGATTGVNTGEANPAPEDIDPEDVIRVNSNLVPVTASVVDYQGKAIADLKLEDFELRVDGQPKQISEIGFSNTPVRLVMLFDNSSSLTLAREFEKQAATKFFRNVMRPLDEAAIFSVSTVPILEQPLTSDVKTLVRTIDRFGKPEGATALFDAIAQAAAYLRPLQGRKVIVIVSDGADTISDLDFDSTLRLAQAADCQLYAVQTGLIENANVRDLAAERRMQEMTAQTGGAVYVPRGTADLDTAFAQISADLAQQYILSYYPTDDPRDGRFRIISLRVATRPNVRVRARKGYYAPKG
ncbi:MAG: VWA domain-containing protein [Pyrinomonadaceae bacterium]